MKEWEEKFGKDNSMKEWKENKPLATGHYPLHGHSTPGRIFIVSISVRARLGYR